MRTKLALRALPGYTHREEMVHMISHLAGCAIGITMMLVCVIIAAYRQNTWGIVTGCIFGLSMLLLFVMSSIYHGLPAGLAKRVFQVLDHCSIYLMIAGTYTPVLLCAFRVAYPAIAWSIFGIVWALAALGVTLTAIDLSRFKAVSMCCYLGMGWCIVFQLSRVLRVYGKPMFVLLLIGGIVYTCGVIFYALGGKRKYMHSVFHFMINIAALLQSLAIALYVMTA